METKGKTLATARIQRVHQGKRRRKETEAQASGRGVPDRKILGTGCFRRGLEHLDFDL